MKRFENAKVGDKVYCRAMGFGEISQIEYSGPYPLGVRFANDECWYTLDGKWGESDVEAILFYVDGDNKYAEERPIEKLDWSKLPVDTKVLVRLSGAGYQYKRYYSHTNTGKGVYAFNDGATSWSVEDGRTSYWSDVELAEDVTIDGVLWPAGTKNI